ncbi:hypothetical protein [Mesorhizobium sp.]|uniref:hypothetical protein n=1 Tax=Mesorhizobium sp. TaxID=1871066 RepID=UPI000FE5CA84|nr:hypothetical protein [Mesorhizobium sp.]RWO82079.1 MAG: hypothetical protein EOQ96_23825 [Mesorhizobium sp.]
MLVNEILSRRLRDRRAVALSRPYGVAGRSGKRSRQKGAGARRQRWRPVPQIQLAWRFLRFQKNSDLAQWFEAPAAGRRKTTRKTMIVALARNLLAPDKETRR